MKIENVIEDQIVCCSMAFERKRGKQEAKRIILTYECLKMSVNLDMTDILQRMIKISKILKRCQMSLNSLMMGFTIICQSTKSYRDINENSPNYC